MSGAASPMSRLGRSVGFRLAFYYGLLVTITMLTTVSIVYMQTVGVLYQSTVRQVTLESQRLVARFGDGGVEAVTREIGLALSDDQNAATEIFLYLDPKGLKLAGNLDRPPANMEGRRGGERRLVLRDGKEVLGYVVSRAMPDGSELFVGEDLRDQQAIDSLVTRGIAVASAVAVVLLVSGLFVFRQELDRSVEPIRRTLTRVATGDIQERVEPQGQEDEFALLGGEINKMLDRIELLMNGVRHVSDIIAHNLRTPLSRILLRLRAAAGEVGIGAAHKRNIEGAIGDIEELISVFEKLLQIAEAEAGTRRMDFQPVALASVVSEVLDFYEAVAEARGARMAFEPSESAIILGDPHLLAGAIANLVDNALKHAGAGPKVAINILTTREHVVLTVEDNGTGIAAHEIKQLGTRFFRLNRSITGHGLGLASAAAIVALHGGRIGFDHASPGLVVRMEFPRLQS